MTMKLINPEKAATNFRKSDLGCPYDNYYLRISKERFREP